MQCEGSKERNFRAVCPNLANCKTTIVVAIHKFPGVIDPNQHVVY